MIVLMCSWLTFVDLGQHQYQCLEFFAGVGRIGRLAHNLGYESTCYDTLYDSPVQEPKRKRQTQTPKSSMDLSSEGGFVLLDPTNNIKFSIV